MDVKKKVTIDDELASKLEDDTAENADTKTITDSITESTQGQITNVSLPLDVREHLMRGNQAQAIATLQEQQGLSEQKALAQIEQYREGLRQRKLELDIQMMNAENKRDANLTIRKVLTWSSYLLIVIITLLILNLILKLPVN